MAELRRLLLSPKRLIILLMIAVINLALFSGYCRAEREQSISYYNSMKSWGVNAQGEDYRQRKQYLEKDYYEYLDYVQNQSQAQSILSSLTEKSSFVERNSEKTAKDYSKLSDITVTDGENRGINAVRDYEITDYLLLIAPLLLILEMLADADSAVGDLTRSTKQGRVPLCAWRILAVVIISAASVLMLYGGNILYTCKFYGNPGFFRAVQSIPEYQLCAMRLSIGECLFAAGLLKALALTVISLFVWVILARFHAVLGWLISGIWLGASFMLYRMIVPTSKINHLKFLNVFAALDGDVFFTNYCNLNLFGRPVGFLAAMLLFCTVLLLTGAVLCLWLIGYAYPKKVGQRMESFKERIAKAATRHLPVHTLFGFEGWKLMIAQKGLLLLLLTGWMGFTLWQDIRVYVPSNSITEQFYTRFEGEITQEKIRQAAYIVVGEVNSIQRDRMILAKKYLIKAEEDRDDEIISQKKQNPYFQTQNDRDIARIRKYIHKSQEELEVYTPLLDSMLKLARFNRKTGKPGWFIRQDTYLILFGDSASERRCCMVLLLWLIFAFSGIQAYDNRYDTRMLLRSTKRGRTGIFKAQAVWVMLLTLFVSVGLHSAYLLHLIRDIGFASPDAPAQSLSILQWIPFPISLRSCVILYLLLRYFAALAVAAAICGVSRFCQTPQKALLAAMVIFLLPSALAESGITQLGFVNIVRLLSCSVKTV